MKANDTHIRIFTRDTVIGYNNSVLFPVYGAEIRSGHALENKGFGRVVSSSRHPYHAANYFFTFAEGFRFNWVTKEIEAHTE